MPFIEPNDWNALDEWDQWVPWDEAILHIQEAEGWSRDAALADFRQALASGLEFGDEFTTPAGPKIRWMAGWQLINNDYLNYDLSRKHWLSSEVVFNFKTKSVYFEGLSTSMDGRSLLWRPMVRRKDIERFWPLFEKRPASPPDTTLSDEQLAPAHLSAYLLRQYKMRVDEFMRDRGSPPSFAEDWEGDQSWARENNVTRERLRTLRKDGIPESYKGGGPRKGKRQPGSGAQLSQNNDDTWSE